MWEEGLVSLIEVGEHNRAGACDLCWRRIALVLVEIGGERVLPQCNLRFS